MNVYKNTGLFSHDKINKQSWKKNMNILWVNVKKTKRSELGTSVSVHFSSFAIKVSMDLFVQLTLYVLHKNCLWWYLVCG